MVASHEDKPLRVWNPRTGKDVRVFDGLPGGRVRCLAVSGDGKFALTGVQDHSHTLKLWDLEKGKFDRELHVSAMPREVWFSPDGKLLCMQVEPAIYFGSDETTAFKVFDIASGDMLWKRGVYDGWSVPQFLPDGKHALVSYQLPERLEKPRQLFCVAATGEDAGWLAIPESEKVGDLAQEWAGVYFRRLWADDKRLMATGDGILWSWDLDKREAIDAVRVATMEDRADGYDWSFTPDGSKLCLTWGRDIGPSRWHGAMHGIKAKIVDTATGKVIHELNCENILVNDHDP